MLLGLMGVLFVAAVIWLTRPLWRSGVSAGQRRRAANVAAYRQRLAELDADAAAGLVDVETATGLRAELDERLLLDADGPEAPTTAASRSWPLTGVLALLVLGVAVAGYLQSGSWKVDQQIAKAPAGGTQMSPGDVDAMVAKLAQRLAENPDDAQGWALLGRSYFVMQRYDVAAKAYARANELTGRQEPDLLVGEGEALGLATDRDLRGKPR